MINGSKRETPKAFQKHNLWCTVLSEQEIYGAVFPGFQVKYEIFTTVSS